MAANILLPLWILLSCVIDALAETCYREDESFTCILGCCEDENYVDCCLGNGASIGIICTCVAVVLSCIGACFRQFRRRNNLSEDDNTQGPSVTVVTNTTMQGAYGNQQMSQYPPPAYPGPPTTAPYPVAPAAYPPKY
ncbi:uncharacterized protein LOC124263295 [Haliotis rubra]|uniref:uncharacterized protein LOC124263295 n=1 Tax=Haliotis rubra TaxID=36100 RepID=UPI001EE528A0|nr:uncharacterized protein LOC124263295 [Haliotis rubra]